MKKNLGTWNNSFIISVENYWKTENEAIGKLQVVGNGFVIALLHEAREWREATYFSMAGGIQDYDETVSFHFNARYHQLEAISQIESSATSM